MTAPTQTYLVTVSVEYTYMHDWSDTEHFTVTHAVTAQSEDEAEAAVRHHYALKGGELPDNDWGPERTAHQWEILDLRVAEPIDATLTLARSLRDGPL
jgi:hypothetical protein